MVCDGYLDLLIFDLLIYYSCSVMNISDLLNIYIIVIMRIYGIRGYFVFIHVLEDILDRLPHFYLYL
jgi:hypothetical protein